MSDTFYEHFQSSHPYNKKVQVFLVSVNPIAISTTPPSFLPRLTIIRGIETMALKSRLATLGVGVEFAGEGVACNGASADAQEKIGCERGFH